MSRSITANPRTRLPAAALLLAILLLSAACGGGGSEGSEGTSGATTATTASSGSQGSNPPPSSSFTVKDLVGTWDNGTYVLTVMEGTEYSVANSDAPDTPVMGGFVAAMGTTVSFATGTSGECPAQTGNYKAALAGDTLTFTVSNDPCEARAAGFTAPFTRTG
jgi:hypothetical protein